MMNDKAAMLSGPSSPNNTKIGDSFHTGEGLVANARVFLCYIMNTQYNIQTHNQHQQ
jgi:hypothetical protein